MSPWDAFLLTLAAAIGARTGWFLIGLLIELVTYAVVSTLFDVEE